MVDVTLLRSVDPLAELLTTPVATIFDLTDGGSAHLERCLACWPHAQMYTLQPVSASPRVTCIVAPRFADTPNWGAAPTARHGVLADIARRRAAASSASGRPAPAVTLDDYAQLEHIGSISLLLLSATHASVETLLGASTLLAAGRIHAVALLAPAPDAPHDAAPGSPQEEALVLLAAVLGKFEVAWAVLDAEAVSLALPQDQGEGPGRPRTWLEAARTLEVRVTGIMRIGTDGAAGLSARDDVGSVPLFLIDANLPALERRRQQLEGARDITCIGAAISDAQRLLTLHIDARGRGSYFATPDAYYQAHPKADIEQFVEVTTCTLDVLAEKYHCAAANVLNLDLQGGELAALRGASQVLKHVDLVSLSINAAPAPRADRNALDTHLSQHGFFEVPLQAAPRYPDGSPQTLVYVRKERLWEADALAMIRRVMQRANAAMCRVAWHGAAAEAALRVSPSLQQQTAFCGLELRALDAQQASAGPAQGLDGFDVLVTCHEGLAAFQALFAAALHSSRLCAVVVWGSLTGSDLDSATRVAFDHGFLLDRESASSSARVFLRSSVIRDAAGWLAANNGFGRRDFRFSALGRMGRFGNQLFQIMHLLLSSLRHDARASICAWPPNEYFQLDFLEGTGQQGQTWEVAAGRWQFMAVWAFETLPDALDYQAHCQWIAPFLSRHAAFINRCFDLKPEWAARARQMIESLQGGSALTAFHVRRTDYLDAVLENPWHQEIPIDWYRQALEAQRGSSIFAASDDVEYVEQHLSGLTLVTHRQLHDCGLPAWLIDHCVMRAADTLLIANSTFSRSAGLLSSGTQTALLPALREGGFAPYSPWHDPAFWSRFDDRYFANVAKHSGAIERWLATVGVPQLLAHEKRDLVNLRSSSKPLAAAATTKVLLRTHFIDAAAVAFAQRIRSESGYDVLFVVDENSGPIAVPPQFTKISVTDDHVRAAGLYAPPDCAWRCGDYAYYLARPQLEGARFVWMIEYDVALNIGDLGEFFWRFDREHPQDFLASYLGEGDPNWGWHPLMRRFVPVVYGCLFPVTRLTLPLIDFLAARRRALGQSEDWSSHPQAFPNDESFTASMAVTGGFACAAFADCWPGVYTSKTFPRNGIPIPSEFATSGRAPGVIFHPVYAGDLFKEKLLSYQGRADPNDLESAALVAEYLAAL